MSDPNTTIPTHQNNLMLQALLSHIRSGSVHHDIDSNILESFSPMSNFATNAFRGGSLPMNVPSSQDTPVIFQSGTNTPGRQSVEDPLSSEAYLAAAVSSCPEFKQDLANCSLKPTGHRRIRSARAV